MVSNSPSVIYTHQSMNDYREERRAPPSVDQWTKLISRSCVLIPPHICGAFKTHMHGNNPNQLNIKPRGLLNVNAEINAENTFPPCKQVIYAFQGTFQFHPSSRPPAADPDLKQGSWSLSWPKMTQSLGRFQTLNSKNLGFEIKRSTKTSTESN